MTESKRLFARTNFRSRDISGFSLNDLCAVAVHELFDLLFVQTIEFPDLPMHFFFCCETKIFIGQVLYFRIFSRYSNSLLFIAMQLEHLPAIWRRRFM